MYTPEHFTLQEMLPAQYYGEQYPVYGQLLWMKFDARGLITCDRLRERYGPAIMNTWWMPEEKWKLYGKEPHQWRGYRDYTSPYVRGRTPSTYGNISQHRYGRGFDLVFLNVTAEQIRQEIIADPFHPDFKYITRIESGVSWLHFDLGNWMKEVNGIKIVEA